MRNRRKERRPYAPPRSRSSNDGSDSVSLGVYERAHADHRLFAATTAFDKIWAQHSVAELPDGRTLLYVDRHLTHDVTSPRAYRELERKGRSVRRPNLTLAVEDHILSTDPGRSFDTYVPGTQFILAQRHGAARSGVPLIGVHDRRQGIVHVIAAELGVALPGTTVVCGDSHTCTLGGVGAMAFGIGTSDVEHVLTTQTIAMHRPRNLRVRFDGRLPMGVGAKDLVLHLIRRLGVRGGVGHAVEFAGSVVDAMDIEARQTLCNMAIEMGARVGFVPADETAFSYLHGRACAPRDEAWDTAVAQWRLLRSDPSAQYALEISISCADLVPQITWGTNPQQTIGIDEPVPDPDALTGSGERDLARRALAYMDLPAGRPLLGAPVQAVFIGSCNSSRLGDLRAAGRIVEGRRVAAGVRALVVPGSSSVRRAAEAEGLDHVFREAGFEWRESACSMCAAVNADSLAPGERCVSTSNRNFEGRQGRDVRTHLASPVMAAAAAISGRIVDVRTLLV